MNNKFENENEEEKLFKKRFLDKTSLHSRRLEVVGERENGRARESVSFSRPRFFLCPLLSSRSPTQAMIEYFMRTLGQIRTFISNFKTYI